jgi:hypothetical protein
MTAMITAHNRSARERAMWISAILLGVVLAFQVFGFPERRAEALPSAADVASSGEFTMLTMPANNEDLLMVLDGRNETLFVYHIRNKTSFELRTGGDVKALFNTGRLKGAGK